MDKYTEICKGLLDENAITEGCICGNLKDLNTQTLIDIWQSDELGHPKSAKITKILKQHADLDKSLIEISTEIYKLKQMLSKLQHDKFAICREIAKVIVKNNGTNEESIKATKQIVKKHQKNQCKKTHKELLKHGLVNLRLDKNQ